MGEVRSAEYYDAVYASSESYQLAPDAAPWSQLWYWATSHIGGEMVFDLGCGPGHLAALLADRGHEAHRYLGADFSSEAIRQAKARVPSYCFKEQTIELAARRVRHAPGATVVFCEVLEHIRQDLAILRALPDGTRVLATLPSHDSASHVRHFKTLAGLCRRYERIVEINSVERVGRCFGLEGIVRHPE